MFMPALAKSRRIRDISKVQGSHIQGVVWYQWVCDCGGDSLAKDVGCKFETGLDGAVIVCLVIVSVIQSDPDQGWGFLN